ncbi:MAG: lipocalin family protein [Gammaproteobacteria bacterium]
MILRASGPVRRRHVSGGARTAMIQHSHAIRPRPESVRGVLTSLLCLALCACTGLPEGVEPVQDFEPERYLGKWYEIARLDHSFERGLTRVTAEYSRRDDGGIRVVNRGYNAEKGEWEQAEGKAYFVRSDDEGYLKVSFFGPFYGAYVVFGLDDENYRYSFVSGPDRSYLWLLARTPKVDQAVIDRFVTVADSLGYPTEELIFVDQEAGP